MPAQARFARPVGTPSRSDPRREGSESKPIGASVRSDRTQGSTHARLAGSAPRGLVAGSASRGRWPGRPPTEGREPGRACPSFGSRRNWAPRPRPPVVERVRRPRVDNSCGKAASGAPHDGLRRLSVDGGSSRQGGPPGGIRPRRAASQRRRTSPAAMLAGCRDRREHDEDRDQDDEPETLDHGFADLAARQGRCIPRPRSRAMRRAPPRRSSPRQPAVAGRSPRLHRTGAGLAMRKSPLVASRKSPPLD